MKYTESQKKKKSISTSKWESQLKTIIMTSKKLNKKKLRTVIMLEGVPKILRLGF